MKELNTVEMKSVSGAGIFSNTFSGVASTIGGVMETFGWKNAKANATDVAKNAGLVIDSAIDTVTSFFKLVLRK
ncbi:hypothetical protein [Rosenbergiella australiborealis]|uniref:Bacteriocin n=1 Tax=Rosenbergiella australiborealis TaxID=1544696 RepID=A0ABS5T8V6_9GAMM|nr:hypothetical protein [Rosenbergiella australiborealis]MBT0727393.1 hypothetical protein [Rosenbergiella australiborealis]